MIAPPKRILSSVQSGLDATLGANVDVPVPRLVLGLGTGLAAVRVALRIALAGTDGVYPDEGLARYEWRRHGTCSGKSPTDYFAAAKAARDSIVIPWLWSRLVPWK